MTYLYDFLVKRYFVHPTFLSILEITTLKDYLQTIMVNGVNSALSINDAINKSLQDSN